MPVFTVYGRPGCGFCYQAVDMLESRDYDVNYIDIYRTGLSKQDVSSKINQPVHTLPQILHGDRYVGGCRELVGYLQTM